MNFFTKTTELKRSPIPLEPCPILLYFIASKIEIDRPLTNNAEKVMIYFQDLPTKALAGIFFASE